MKIYYYEYYPHYAGSRSRTVVFTEKQFEAMLAMAQSVVDNKVSFDDFSERLNDLCEEQDVEVFGLDEAVIGLPGPKGYDSIMINLITKGLKKKGVFADEWQEGSYAFAYKLEDAKKAVGKIEAKHTYEQFC